jgi:3-oxoacyl-[acyl-carrier-protein] synthase II
MNERLAITGVGLITPLGKGADMTWRALLEGRFIRDHARCEIGEPTIPRATQLALVAAKQAIGEARWTELIIRDEETALVVGTSKGPVEAWITAPTAPPLQMADNVNVVAGELSFGLGELTTCLAREVGHGAGPRTALSAACASGIHALIHAIVLLRSGVARRALVVATEASVHPLFIGSFRRLGVLPREGVGCRPFDRARNGFLMSEAAAAVCLEIADETRQAYAFVDRFALAADATHLTGGDPSGRALKHILARVIDNQPIDLIHAHATGTVLHDPVELDAIESSLTHGDPAPSVYSHKGALGHSLGAAGLVAVVLNCLSHRTGIIPGNIRTTRPLPTHHASIAQEPAQRPIRRSLALAAGFGGAMGAVSLKS